MLGITLGATLLTVVWLAVTASVAGGPVARVRLATFARRHDLVITPANGEQVIHYLATTRRWRAAGLTAGFIASVAWALPQQRVHVNFLALFAGWFAGALVAEARVAHLASGERRAASLVPRRMEDYRSGLLSALLPASVAVSLAIAAASLAAGSGLAGVAGAETAGSSLAGPAVASAGGPSLAGALWLAVALVVASGVRVIERRVLHRPQPLAPPDQLAADDAIRSRSLHVLAAGGATLVFYCVLGQLAALRPALTGTAGQLVELAAFLGVFAAPALGLLAASAHWPVSRRLRVEPA